MNKSFLIYLIFLVVVTTARPIYGWHENGHQLIALMAFDMLEPDDQEILAQLLRSHPNFEVDFAPPATVQSTTEFRRWVIGRSGYWPDVARRYEQWNRPSWHYQLGVTKRIGAVVNMPNEAPFLAPTNANGQSQSLHVLEAIDLNVRVLRDRQLPASERAVAICWLFHLIADIHQPCHAGSLYMDGVFPDGDRGANGIKLAGGSNLHALWDSLLGSEYDSVDIDRRIDEIYSNQRVANAVAKTLARNNTNEPSDWMLESRLFGERFVYTNVVLESLVTAGSEGAVKQLRIELSPAYLSDAKLIAQRQAYIGSVRLAKTLASALEQSRDSSGN